MNKHTVERIVQAVSTLILFALIFFMIAYVNDIQGTARIVNYAGLVRGETQRLVKLEIAGVDSPKIMDELNEYVDGIENGSSRLSLIKIDEAAYQAKVSELHTAWQALKQEIARVRVIGYMDTDIVAMSEDYFRLSDEVVALAEKYSQMCATNIRRLEIAVILCIAFILAIMLKQSIQAIQVIRMNHELKEKVFWDEQTGLPNKNRCTELLGDAALLETSTVLFMFDLNNLKYVNDNMGHEAGDLLIASFAKLIRASVPEPYFVGRYGGDEFIVILSGEDRPGSEEIVQSVSEQTAAYNKIGDGIPISYAVGFAESEEFEACTLRVLLAKADKKMYENKKLTKKSAEDMEKQMDHTLRRMIQAMGNAYKDSCICNAQTGDFRMFQRREESILPRQGSLQADMENCIRKHVYLDDQDKILKMLELSYIKEHLNAEHTRYDMTCRLETDILGAWWKLTVVFVDAAPDGTLFHFLILFEEVSQEVELAYEAKHDGLTGLWNKTAAFQMIEEAMRTGAEYTMFVLDIDDFKQVNDTLGHPVGDEVLKQLADILAGHFRKSDIAARFGGDEFFVFATDFLTGDLLEEKAQRLIDDVAAAFYQKYDNMDITISMGIAKTEQYMDVQELFHQADEALYQAKKSGKNKFCCRKDLHGCKRDI